MNILNKIDLNKEDVLIVDGYVYLDDNEKNGLGGYLYDSLNQLFPVIGIAKRNFVGIKNQKREVVRGNSKNPLYITSAGIDLDKSANYVRSMHGEYRIPSILKIVDQKSRKIL